MQKSQKEKTCYVLRRMGMKNEINTEIITPINMTDFLLMLSAILPEMGLLIAAAIVHNPKIIHL